MLEGLGNSIVKNAEGALGKESKRGENRRRPVSWMLVVRMAFGPGTEASGHRGRSSQLDFWKWPVPAAAAV
jgi:hypothetical protein